MLTETVLATVEVLIVKLVDTAPAGIKAEVGTVAL